MRLLTSRTSPYGRKVRLVAAEKGLSARIELVEASSNMPASGLIDVNPLNKIPTLVRADGTALYDSPVICAYLDELGDGPRLIPDGAARWDVLKREALCDGILDAAFNTVMEKKRTDAERSPAWLDRWAANIARAVAAAEADLGGTPAISTWRSWRSGLRSATSTSARSLTGARGTRPWPTGTPRSASDP